MGRFDDDDDGQVEGDGPPPGNPFVHATSMRAAPWLRGGMPPWHMWGNSETITVRSSGVLLNPTPSLSQQLARVSYGRPETWHWLFHAKLVAAESLAALENSAIFVNFEISVGLGRSRVTIPIFNQFIFAWGDIVGTPNPPLNSVIYSTKANSSPQTIFSGAAPAFTIDQIVAQDIQCAANIQYQDGTAVRSATVEVSAFWAPKNHVRPDWFRDGPEEQVFPGAEIAGR